MHLAVVVPVKAFDAAKARLHGALDDTERSRLARWTASRVIEAARPACTFVACDSDDVATLAESLGASVLWCPGLGLNGAIDHAVDTITGTTSWWHTSTSPSPIGSPVSPAPVKS
ncbi:MAG: hypothetical protein ACO3D0_05580 [Ilumatobacteraceae bacterium]